MRTYADVIKRPIVTEKTAEMSIGQKYVFEVAYDADKTLVKEAVEALFEGVFVEKVNVMNVKPTVKMTGRYVGKTKRVRKAIITLTPESKAIELF